ncbi:MAG: SDR family NAD(P)-dependent oxidoreductase [Anaerolineales bacterium]
MNRFKAIAQGVYMRFDFSDHVVVLPGALGDLASDLAQRFRNSGAQLALLDRGMGRLTKKYPNLVDQFSILMVDNVDLTNLDSVEVGISKVISHFGNIDILVNTVGGFRSGTTLHETSLETWDLMMDLNARSVFLACHAVIPYMLEQGCGKIVSVAARPGLKGNQRMAAYSASKSVVIRLTESMAAELKNQGINVNCIIPGTIDTPSNRESMPQADYTRWVDPGSTADVIMMLTSELARDIHGASISVYGKS